MGRNIRDAQGHLNRVAVDAGHRTGSEGELIGRLKLHRAIWVQSRENRKIRVGWGQEEKVVIDVAGAGQANGVGCAGGIEFH